MAKNHNVSLLEKTTFSLLVKERKKLHTRLPKPEICNGETACRERRNDCGRKTVQVGSSDKDLELYLGGGRSESQVIFIKGLMIFLSSLG
jgi:hypothetical protein